MIIVIIGLVCLVIAITLTIIDKVVGLNNWLEAIGFITWLVAIIVAVFFVFCNIACGEDKIRLEEEYAKLYLVHQVALDETNPITIYELNKTFEKWNNKVDEGKRLYNSPWTNWLGFVNTTENIEHIELLENIEQIELLE